MILQAKTEDFTWYGFGTALLAVVILACFHPSTLAADRPHENNKTILMGVFPYVSGMALFKRYAPLKDYLANELGRELVLETARDFPTFVQRTVERRYDIVMTAPHFALLAADSGDYQIVTRPKRDLVPLILVPGTSAMTDLSQLAGQVIATPPASALVTQYGKDYLAAQGLNGDMAPEYHAYKSHNAAYEAILDNHAAASLVALDPVRNMIEQGVPVRVIARLPPLPALATLVATDLSTAFAQQVENIFVMMEDTDTGRDVLKEVGFTGYISTRVEDYKAVRPYKPASANIVSEPIQSR